MKNIIKWGNILPEKICSILMFILSLVHLIISIVIGYYFSFVPTELEILRSSTPTVIIDINNPILWIILSSFIFIVGILILKMILECLYIILSKA